MLFKNPRLGAVWVLVAGSTGGLAGALSAQERANPYTAVPDVRGGQLLFARQCSVCHGEGGAGGEVGPDLTTGDFQRASTDAGLFNLISEGIPNTAMMGINATRTDQSVWQIVAYLRSVSGGERVAVAGNGLGWGASLSWEGRLQRLPCDRRRGWPTGPRAFDHWRSPFTRRAPLGSGRSR